jgi:cell division protein FtsN
MAFGLTIGLVVAIGVYVNDRRPPGQEDTAAQGNGVPRAASQPAATPRPTAPTPTPAAPEEERFGFYELLPRFEVVVPELETPAQSPNRAVTITEPGIYVLQAGSFGTEKDAEAQRARLGLLGIEAKVQRVVVDDREFHRVRIGPLDDLDALNSLRRRLLDAKIDSIVMRMTD